MDYGITIFPTDYSMPMDLLGPAVEERGFESLWVAEHSHIPASRESPWPGGPELPKMYFDTFDPFVALTAAAVNTTTLKLGTGIALVIQRDPIHTAKAISSLDHISGGRVLVGVGAGWNLEEMRNHGTDPDRRFGLMRESVEAMKAIWTQDVPEYHGDQINFDPMYQYPKPIQKPHPPVHVGGGFPGGMKRAVRYANGWLPIGGRGAGDLGPQMAALDEECKAAGRDRSEIEVTIFAAHPKREALDELAEFGVDRAIFMAPPAPAAELIPRLDTWAELIR